MTETPGHFFEQGFDASAPRLLLISYHFAPAQSAGALRWERFSSHAAERGWAMDVVTLHPSSLSNPDTRRLAELPAGIRLYGVREAILRVERLEQTAWRWVRRLRPKRTMVEGGAITGESPSLSRAQSYGRAEIRWTLGGLLQGLRRAYSSWLDYSRQRQWARAAAGIGLGLSRATTYRAVISCGPPHMAHEAGRQVAAARRLPHVVDLRDPWSLVQRLPEAIASPLLLALAARHERRVVARAALVVANTEPLQLALQARYPEARSRITTVMNGYDEDPMPQSRPGRRFTVAYAGAIYLDRNPRALFTAAARVVRELGLSSADIRIELMGDVASFDGVPTEVIAREEGLEGFVGTRPAGSRREAMEFLAGASMLLSLPQDSDMAIPSKIFEYMQYDAWILALAERDSATERALRGSGADVVSAADLDGLVRVLRRRYEEHARGESPVRLATDPRYSRRHQAQRLLDALDGCLPDSRASGARAAGSPAMARQR